MKIVLLLTLFLPLAAQTSDFEIWRTKEKHYLLSKDSQKQQLISKYCLEKKNLCMATEALHSNKQYTLKNDVLKGGKNPGAVVCAEFLKEKVLILSDQLGNQASFCEFKDGSLLSTQAFTKFAE